MKIIVSGATGPIGRKLIEALALEGHDDIHILTRNKKEAQQKLSFPIKFFNWSPEENYIEEGALEGADVVIHLAGENISDGRWNNKKKDRILKSRQISSEFLIQEIKKLNVKPKKIISSSAVGIYGDTGTREITEKNLLGDDFLSRVCKVWEDSILNHNINSMSSHCIRTGIVLTNTGGALQKMLPAFMAGVGGTLGSGNQYMSWIHIDDLISMFLFLIKNDAQSRVYNGSAPNPVTNKEFTKALGSVINRPTILPVPAPALKVIFGEMAEILLTGQRVLPENFLQEGFKFKFTNIKDALFDILKYHIKNEVVLKKYQWVNSPIEKVFNFFSEEVNLEIITPPYLQFKVKSKSTPLIRTGTLINYKLKIHGIPLQWQSKISNFEVNKSFTDIQLSGPYTKWEHKHDFIPMKKGTLMVDEVVYKVPMGILGKLTVGYFVNRDVQNIFKYRNQVICQKFNFKGDSL